MLSLSFSKFFVPSATGFVGKKEEDWWIFTSGCNSLKVLYFFNFIFVEGDKDNEVETSRKRQEDTPAKAVSSTGVTPVIAVSGSSPPAPTFASLVNTPNPPFQSLFQ